MQNNVLVSFEMLPHSPTTNSVQYKLMKENMFKVNELHLQVHEQYTMYNSDGWKMVMADYILNDFKNKYLQF